MIEKHSVFKPNQEDVAAKVIDDELIIVRLSDGTYYSMRNVGTRVWELLEAGHNLQSTAGALADWYDMPIEDVLADVESLVSVLLDEGLIAVTPSANGAGTTVSPPGDGAMTYKTPQVEIYRDMGNLLALDPPTPGIDDLMFRGSKDE